MRSGEVQDWIREGMQTHFMCGVNPGCNGGIQGQMTMQLVGDYLTHNS